jgi:hypothetical protein
LKPIPENLIVAVNLVAADGRAARVRAAAPGGALGPQAGEKAHPLGLAARVAGVAANGRRGTADRLRGTAGLRSGLAARLRSRLAANRFGRAAGRLRFTARFRFAASGLGAALFLVQATEQTGFGRRRCGSHNGNHDQQATSPHEVRKFHLQVLQREST